MRRAAILTAALAVAAAGCGDPDSTYVANDKAGMFVRLPADWAQFQVSEADPTADPRSDPTSGRWRVVFDASDDPARANVEAAQPEAPVGFAEITPASLVADSQGNRIPLNSHRVLRSSLLGFAADPLDAESGAEVLVYEELDFGSHWGNRLTTIVDQDGIGPLTVTQFAFVDAGGRRLYVLRMLCTTTCYDDNADEIDAVLDSFTLEG